MSKYIENEVLVAEPVSGDPGVPSCWQVIASRVDPSFIGGEAPRLAPIDAENEQHEYALTECVSYEEGEDFDDAWETLRTGDYETAALSGSEHGSTLASSMVAEVREVISATVATA